MIRSTRGIF